MNAPIPSKRFPFIDLEKALGRAATLYTADQNGRPMAPQLLFEIWEYSKKSSGGHQTIGALKTYGLIAKDSQGRIGLTENALRYFKDERPAEKERLLKLFALRPKMLGFLWGEWSDKPPADNVARSFLKLDVGLGEQQSRTLLGIYKDNLNFANLKGGDTIAEGETDGDDDEEGEVNNQAGTASSNPGGSSKLPPLPMPQEGAGRERNASRQAADTGWSQWLHNTLSTDTKVQILVAGHMSPREIGKLIKLLEAQKAILEDE
jgi:hypothetical protein